MLNLHYPFRITFLVSLAYSCTQCETTFYLFNSRIYAVELFTVSEEKFMKIIVWKTWGFVNYLCITFMIISSTRATCCFIWANFLMRILGNFSQSSFKASKRPRIGKGRKLDLKISQNVGRWSEWEKNKIKITQFFFQHTRNKKLLSSLSHVRFKFRLNSLIHLFSVSSEARKSKHDIKALSS